MNNILNKHQLASQIAQELKDGENIYFNVSVPKDIINVSWSLTFEDMSYQKAYELHEEEILWANQKLEQLANNYSNIHLYTRKLTFLDIEYFDYLLKTKPSVPVKKAFRNNLQTMCGFVQFNFKK